MNDNVIEGGCSCRTIRYRLVKPPLFVNCCHCTWCQRESGSAFVINGMIEASAVELVSGAVRTIDTPSASGIGQRIARCPECCVAVWSVYGDMNLWLRFVRLGTLDDPGAFPPDIHIFTSTKQPWVTLDPDTPVVPRYYDKASYWPEASLERYETARATA